MSLPRRFAIGVFTALTALGLVLFATLHEPAAFPDSIWMRSAPPPLLIDEPRVFLQPGGDASDDFVVVISGRHVWLSHPPGSWTRLLGRIGVRSSTSACKYVVDLESSVPRPEGWRRLVPDAGER